MAGGKIPGVLERIGNSGAREGGPVIYPILGKIRSGDTAVLLTSLFTETSLGCSS